MKRETYEEYFKAFVIIAMLTIMGLLLVSVIQLSKKDVQCMVSPLKYARDKIANSTGEQDVSCACWKGELHCDKSNFMDNELNFTLKP